MNQGLPFGGRKDSGYGRFAGPEGLLGLTAPKAVTEDVAFGLVQTSIPPVVDYPLSNTQRSWTCMYCLTNVGQFCARLCDLRLARGPMP